MGDDSLHSPFGRGYAVTLSFGGCFTGEEMSPWAGQSSVELLSFLGFFILAISAVYLSFYPGWEEASRVGMAEASAGDLKVAVERAYSGGIGHKETISVRVPSGVSSSFVGDNRLMWRLKMGSGFSDVLEVSSAPVVGYLPVGEGVHRVSVEHVRSGVVVVGGGLSIDPSFVRLDTTSGNVSNFIVNVSDVADVDFPRINLSVVGDSNGWFSFNESGFDLRSGESRLVLIGVDTPVAQLPGVYVDYLRAKSSAAYAESVVDVVLGSWVDDSDCVLGESRSCGDGECAGGVQSCVFDGTRYVWGGCSSFGGGCASMKCCVCGGAPGAPGAAFDGSRNGDCAGRVKSCLLPGSCVGVEYGFECSGLGSCSADYDNSSGSAVSDYSACAGASCSDPANVCYDQEYPCHGRRTSFTCDGGGSCRGSMVQDDTVCAGFVGCAPPTAIVLHKLDVNEYVDYVESPMSHFGFAGGYPVFGDDGHCISSCAPLGQPNSPFAKYTFTNIQYPDAGAYYPYRNGKLRIYGKAYQVNEYCAWRTGNDYNCRTSCVWTDGWEFFCGGNKLRIGNNQTSYFEYPGPRFDWGGWQRYTVDLSSPSGVVGSPDWNGSIGFLQFSYVAGSRCPSRDYGPCFMYEDIVTLER